ncbi:MAG: hypothetical protein U9N58_07400 [Thermodesulfobacteriota bacterium]|nr:hypothetical protein [Thermodesulfobacteriota bacterium]
MAQVIIQPKNADNLKSLVKTAVENQMRVLSYGIAKTKRKLEELEKETGLDSRDFYKKFRKGELGDDFKYIRWAGEYETLEQLQRDFNDLQEAELCS